MIPSQYIVPYLVANAVALTSLGVAWRWPRAGRWIGVMVFAWAAVTNTSIAIARPSAYIEYGALTPSSVYRDFILGWFSGHVRLMVLPIAAGQAAIAVLLASRSLAYNRLGAAGALIFLLAIAPLGLGSGFPFSVTFGAAMLLAVRAPATARRAGGAVPHGRAYRFARVVAGLLFTAAATGLAGYGTLVALAYAGYGQVRAATGDVCDPLLDRFMPDYEIVERHAIAVNAPASVTLQAAGQADLGAAPLVRAIFATRARVLGARAEGWQPRPLVAYARSIGWGVLAEAPDREIVFGAVTQPWAREVVFRPLTPDAFAAFDEPGYVKIIWTLRADPVDAQHSIFRTETRAIATDATARARFRSYWSRFSPGIALIRRLMLAPVKSDAERRAQAPERF